SIAGVVVCFFFHAEDGIRVRNVTGVQTCALPIWSRTIFKSRIVLTQQDSNPGWYRMILDLKMVRDPGAQAVYCSINPHLAGGVRSEERRVGKVRAGWRVARWCKRSG